MKKISIGAILGLVASLVLPTAAFAAAKPTTTSITTSASPVVINTAVSLTATVNGSGNPAGTVAFAVGGTSIGSCTTTSGACSITYTWTARGEYPVIATYTPSTNHSSSVSAPLTEVVTRHSSSVVVASSKPDAYIGNPLDFTITASGAGPTPTGTVNLYAYESNTVIGTCALSAGSCVIHLAASTVGNHRVWAGYSGDDVTYLPSNSAYIYQHNMAKLTPTIALTQSAASTDFGGAVTFTATLSGSSGTPVGSILFENTELSLGSCTLVAGTCSLTYSTLSAGPHQIVAEFGGDDTYVGAEATITHQVNSLTSASLVADPRHTAIGSLVTLTATFPSAGSYAGTVIIAEDGTPKGSCTLASSTCTYSYMPTTAANHLMTATLLGNQSLETSTASIYVPVVTRISTLTLTSSSNPAPRLTLVTFTAALHSSATGLVIFENSEGQIGSCTLSAGQCAITVSFATMGNHDISAEYSGDSLNSDATTHITQIIGITTTTIALTSDLAPAQYYNTINFTATVSDSTATGTISVFDGDTGIKSCTLTAGACTLFYYRLSVGSHNMTAVYGGDATHAGSTSPVFIQVVDLGPTTTAVTSNENPFAYGAGLTLTATVSSSGVGATGSVQFEDYTSSPESILGTCTLSGTTCSIVLDSPLPIGARKIRAEYSSDGKYAGSVSPQFTQVISAPISDVSIVSSDSVIRVGQTVTLTINVAANGNTATGTVQLKDSGANLGSALPLVNGSATFVTAALAPGTHVFTAVYSGDSQHAAATSPELTETVQYITSATATVIPVSVMYLEPFTVTSVLSNTYGSPTGSVIIEEELVNGADVILGSCTLTSGTCTYTNSSLAVGTHEIYIEYAGTGLISGAASRKVIVTVTPRPVQSVVAQPAPVAPAAPVATLVIGTPIVALITPDKQTDVSFTSLDASGRKSSISISVPAGAISGSATISISSEPDAVATEKGFGSLVIRILSTTSTPVETLAKPISLKISRQGTLVQPAISEDGLTWVALQKVVGTTLDQSQSRGYYIGANKSLNVLTLQMSVFDLLKKQYLLFVRTPASSVQVGQKVALAALGGSGKGALAFTTSTRAICSVSSSGELVALSAGSCSVSVAKAHDETHMNASSPAKVIVIKP